MTASPRHLRLLAGTVAACFAAGLAALALGAGGGDGDAATTAAARPAAPNGSAIAVTALDYRYDGMPDRVPAGSRLTLHNASTTEAHRLVAVRLDDADERTVDELAALDPTVVVVDPAADLLAGPGGGDGGVVTLSEPGRYLVLCTLPTGSDAGAVLDGDTDTSTASAGRSHAEAGMYAQLVVA